MALWMKIRSTGKITRWLMDCLLVLITMDLPEPGKLFVARLPKTVSESNIKEHFNKYGEVKDCVIVVDKVTRRPKGFAFVTFTDPFMAKKALEVEHYIFGRKLDVKPALPKREELQNQEDEQAKAYFKTKKIFVGGLPHNLTQEEFKSYFEKFGTIINGVIIYIKESGKSRGFGFITFDSEEAVDEVTKETHHELNDKFVEVKRAWPKHKNDNMIHTFDCNEVGFNFGGSQCDYYSNFMLYGARCFSCLLPYGFGHHEGCLYYGQNTAGYITWQPKKVPTNFGMEKTTQTHACPYENSV
ncbi:heterogeneous nuclear ribonucleoprotein 1 isoform X2 [Prunus persica]|uniref:heterogeneous nuclear ribonucleoprotein 1 isoform X2 n=1 Tax=Prunus persica TaxID=3760 RepID=UPI0009AB4D08|nr:heterogeneous nuclear ribonucleoprotein 1 isoform X2 [Prunus persica]